MSNCSWYRAAPAMPRGMLWAVNTSRARSRSDAGKASSAAATRTVHASMKPSWACQSPT